MSNPVKDKVTEINSAQKKNQENQSTQLKPDMKKISNGKLA